jgi:hypothetical protein
MSQQYYLPASDAARATWLVTFAATAPTFAAKYGLTAAELASLAADAVAFGNILAAQNTFINLGQQLTAYKNALRNGLPAGQVPAVPTVPALVLGAPVAPGIFQRTAALVNRIKTHLQYTDADGQAMGISGAEDTVAARVDPSTTKPTLVLRLAAGGQVEVVWKKAGHSAVEIQVDRHDGKGWALLAIDTQPNYLDTYALPAPGQSAKWSYRALYRDADEPVGQWSDVVSMAVAG